MNEAVSHGPRRLIARPLAVLAGGASGSFWAAAAFALSAVLVLLIFRAYLLPNVVPAWYDTWRQSGMHHPGLAGARCLAAAATAFATFVFGSYFSHASKRYGSFGLWLVTGAWLAFSVAVILVPWLDAPVVAREGALLLGYASGLAAARVFRRLDDYVLALVACGAVQSVVAVAYHAMRVDAFVPGAIVPAGGTFHAPGALFLVPLFILPFAAQGILVAERTASRAFFMLCAAGITAALILTWELSGVAAALLSVLWLARKLLAGRRQLAALALAFVLIFAVIYVRGGGPMSVASAARSAQGRARLILVGASTFSRHWLDGVGVGRLLLPMQVEISGRPANVFLPDPSNQFLFCLDEMGVAGAVLIGAFAWFIYRTVRESRSRWTEPVAAAWISVALAGLFNTLFGWSDFGPGGMLFGSLLGITMRLSSNKSMNNRVAGEGSPPVAT